MNLIINNKKDPFNDFKKIAESLIIDSVLVVGESKYQFTALEFYYLNVKDDHADVYSHKHRYQTKSGQWYFHGSGLDITFGDNDTYGGILIRGLKDLEKNTFINGPLLCVQEIFQSFGGIDNKEKASFYIQDLPCDEMDLHIEKEPVYYSKRVGLNQAKDTDGRFYNGLYRFFINPGKTQKDKAFIADDLLEQVKSKSKSEVNTLFGYRHFKL